MNQGSTSQDRFKIIFMALFVITSFVMGLTGLGARAASTRLVTARPALDQVVLSAFTRARAEMQVASEVAARCLEVNADVGQALGPDGVLAVLDGAFVRLELERTRSEMALQDSRREYLERQVARYRHLVKKKSEALAKLEELELELDQTKHQKQALKASSEILKERLQRHLVLAPAGWQVIERKVEPGQWVAAGAPLARVGDFRTLLAPLALTSAQFRALEKMPKPLKLKVAATGQEVAARVERISPAFDPATRKIKVDLLVSGGLHPMRGGVRLELTLDLPDSTGAVFLPSQAVTERYQEHWVTPAGGKPLRVVILGKGPDGALRVTGPGLAPGRKFELPE